MIVGKSRGLTGSDYADVIELHTLRNLLKEKLKERDFVFVSKFSLQADKIVSVSFLPISLFVTILVFSCKALIWS